MEQLSERRAALLSGCEPGGRASRAAWDGWTETEEPILAEVQWSQCSSLMRVGSGQQPA